ncbi:hypothetical protein TRFO_40988 [Tritrichomonas foetus]|uniref:protein-serine/threonine phosphatase n=1 Tax=Tritrichomonas foetus TaxID=1144522 RepID=A0A1J4J689_9EUKA|nr:hypothetical protein TRFO_40988 [Tritrichomonas foetus]|eukprot:OHS92692.1 hypothetical protein TRFO_40988 [Tritrichomonas foetus]
MSEKCTHGVIFDTLCAWCGKDLGPLKSTVAFPHSRSITFSETEVKNVVNDHVAHMIKSKKLSLLIHMEQVILDAINVLYLPKMENTELGENEFIVDVNTKFKVVLRPYLKEFLESLHDKFEMTLFTLNSHEFAAKILEKIDPQNKYFNTRIMAPNSMIERNISKMYYDSSHLMVILDVSSQNWKDVNGFPVEGFIEVSPFVAFGETPRAPHFPILPPKYSDYFEKKNDKVLTSLSTMLLKIYDEFFNHPGEALLDALQNVNGSILENCRICISETLCPFDHHYFMLLNKYLSKLGASFNEKYDPSITHVIADSDCALVKEAQEYNGVHIISFDWLIESCTNYCRCDEKNYSIPGIVSPTQGQKEIEIPASDKELSSSEFERMLNDDSNQETTSSDDDEEESDDRAQETFEIEK